MSVPTITNGAMVISSSSDKAKPLLDDKRSSPSQLPLAQYQ